MKPDIPKAQWPQIKNGIQANWDRITEDDLEAISGNEKSFLAVLQKKYGYSEDTAQREYRKFMKRQAKEKRVKKKRERERTGH